MHVVVLKANSAATAQQPTSLQAPAPAALPFLCPPALPCSMLEVIRPLGLPSARLGAITGLSRDFLAADWEDPSEFKGFGAFSADSWAIFCRGRLAMAGVEDKNLLRYLRWRASGSTEDPHKQKQQRERKRKVEEKPAAAGTLRSGRRRGGAAKAAAPPAGERRQTRASAAAAESQGAGSSSKARKGRRG